MATKIQLFNDEDLSLAIGYLDVSDNIPLPITYSVSDVKNVGERTASSTKSVILPGTKNNNQLFGQLFDVNIEFGLATYNIYKKQKCAIITDNKIVMDNAFLQLVSVTKNKNTQTQEDEIKYEVIIKSQVFNFFTQIQNAYLDELDFSRFNHEFSSTQINSAMDNTWVDGYKYIFPYTSGTTYTLNQLKPSIYAKQYWDEIHSKAGYTYEWDSISDDYVRFDDMLITSNNTNTVISNYINNDYIVQALNSNHQHTLIVSDDLINGTYTTQIDYNHDYDPSNKFNLSTNAWTNPFTYPDKIQFIANLFWNVYIDNSIYNEDAYIGDDNSFIKVYFVIYDPDTSTELSVTEILNKSYNAGDFFCPAAGGYLLDYAIYQQVIAELSNIPLNRRHQFYFRYDFDIRTTNLGGGYLIELGYYTEIESNNIGNLQIAPDLTIKYASENVPYGMEYPINTVIPTKFKQRDFIDSIIKMFNLYVEPDKLNPRNLIYKRRDDFYDQGKVLDWSNKLMVDMDQKIEFLSDLNFKNLVLTHKEDSDDANKTYKEATKEIYGQITTTFDTEWLKNTETITTQFSPTPVKYSGWYGPTPIIDYSTNFNVRILLDIGRWFNSFVIVDYVSYFPTVIHYTNIVSPSYILTADSWYHPTYDINFGKAQYYFYETSTTDNNLYHLNWKRTYQQLNSSRLLTAYFDLNEVDIANLSLSSKIWCMNKYWLINAIIDYDANANKPTQVELISYEENGIIFDNN